MDAFFDSLKAIINAPFWPDLAKIVLGTIMLASAAVALAVALYFARWHEQLVALEKLADTTRDDVMFEMTAARQRLADLRNKVVDKPDKTSGEEVAGVLKTAGSVLSLVIAREKSLINWSIAGARFAWTAFNYLKSRSKN